ncbi:hypothetical protein B1A_21006, partial [mine drainage metagenome]
MEDLIDQWIANIKDSRSPTTIREYRRFASVVIKPELGAVTLSKLTACHLNALYASLTAEGNRHFGYKRNATVVIGGPASFQVHAIGRRVFV